MNKTATYTLLIASAFTLPPLQAYAEQWELKADIDYVDGAVAEKISYKKDGRFDDKTIKQKRKSILKTELNYLTDSPIEALQWGLRSGYEVERNKDREIQLREDGTLKKDKSRTEWQRNYYLGAALRYTTSPILGSDRWVISSRYDRYLLIKHSTSNRHADAKDRNGDTDGYEWNMIFRGEYSTPWLSFYLLPYIEYKQKGSSHWIEDRGGKEREAEQEQQTEAGLFLNWISPFNGWELTLGPYWQRELDGEKAADEKHWSWSDDERWIATVKLEYASPLPGFEMELAAERHLNGEDKGEMRYKLELSYEF